MGRVLPQLVNLALVGAVEEREVGVGVGVEAGAAPTGGGTPRLATPPPPPATPRGALSALLLALAGRSLPLGARIHWLLSAAAADDRREPGGGGDGGGAAAAAALRDACERASLEGTWDPPFTLGVTSPAGSPPPAGSAGRGAARAATLLMGGGGGGRAASRRPTSPLAGAGRRALSPPPSLPLSPAGSDAADEPGGGVGVPGPPLGGRGRAASTPTGSFASAAAAAGAAAGLEGLFCSSPPPASPTALAVAVAGGGGLDGGERAAARASHHHHHPSSLLSTPPPTPALPCPASGAAAAAPPPPAAPASPATLRASTFSATLDFVEALADAAAGLAAFPPPARGAALAAGLADIDREVAAASAAGAPVWWPLPRPAAAAAAAGAPPARSAGLPACAPPERVVRVVAEQASLLNSRDKAPFLVWLEVLGQEVTSTTSQGGGAWVEEDGGRPPPTTVAGAASALAGLPAVSAAHAPAPPAISHARAPSDEAAALAAVAAAARAAAAGAAGGPGALAAAFAAAALPPPPPASRPRTPPTPPAALPQPATAARDAATTAAHRGLYGTPAARLASALRSASPHGRAAGWAARPVIVKAGDDGRQEALAAALLATLDAGWRAAGLPLALTPFAVLPAGPAAALVEAVPNSLSLHALKRALGLLAAAGPAGAGAGAGAGAAGAAAPPLSLAAHFAAAHPPGTPDGEAARAAFVSSLAASSLASYLLAIKDRHNGNILLTSAGALVHVDFGFMLGGSPGGIAFEGAPFKLSRELMEVLEIWGGGGGGGGGAAPSFDAFRLLFVRGLLAARPLADALATLVEAAGTGPGAAALPCFRAAGGGARAAAGVRARLLPGLPDGKAVTAALALVDASADAWRTRQYDYYQRVLNGIL